MITTIATIHDFDVPFGDGTNLDKENVSLASYVPIFFGFGGDKIGEVAGVYPCANPKCANKLCVLMQFEDNYKNVAVTENEHDIAQYTFACTIMFLDYEGDKPTSGEVINVYVEPIPAHEEPPKPTEPVQLEEPAEKWEYTTGYLLHDEDKNINEVTEMLNSYGATGWRWTGEKRSVQNGMFYLFERRIPTKTTLNVTVNNYAG